MMTYPRFVLIALGTLLTATVGSITFATGDPANGTTQSQIELVEVTEPAAGAEAAAATTETAPIKTTLFKDKSCATLITPRGSFGLSINREDHTAIVYEWGGKGYGVTTSIVAAKNGFAYFKMDDVKFAMAVREEPVCGMYQVYFYVDGDLDTPHYFSEGPLYLVK